MSDAPGFPGQVSLANFRTNSVPTAELGSVGAKGETKLLMPWAPSVCMTLGKSLHLSLPHFRHLVRQESLQTRLIQQVRG